MNAAPQLGKIRDGRVAPGAHSSDSAPSRRSTPNKILIATVSRLEISVTRSDKRRKHFLIATRNEGWFVAGTRLPFPQTAKINRKPELIDTPASCSIQETTLKSIGNFLALPPIIPVRTLTRSDGVGYKAQSGCVATRAVCRVTWEAQ